MLELNVARLSNVVTFQVNRPSLEKAKAEVEKLRKQMAAVKDIELRVKTHKQSTAKAKKDVDDIAKKQAQADKANAKAQLAAQRVVAREQKALAARKEKADLKLLDVGASISALHRLSVFICNLITLSTCNTKITCVQTSDKRPFSFKKGLHIHRQRDP